MQKYQLSLADRMLKQLQAEYEDVQRQNIKAPLQNLPSQEDEQNPYQSIDMASDQDEQSNQQPQIRIEQKQKNPQQRQQLIEVQPLDESIFKVPQKQFQIDQEKIKKITLAMKIQMPDWLKDQSLCQKRIQELFVNQKKKKQAKVQKLIQFYIKLDLQYLAYLNRLKNSKIKMEMEIQQTSLIKLKHSKEHIQLLSIKEKLSQFSKYFFSVRQNITIVYDKSILYILHKQSTKVVDLGKQYVITDLVYHFEKNILVFLTIDGFLHLHFVNSKTQIIIRKDQKKQKPIMFDWIYDSGGVCHFFIAEESGVKFYKLQEEKKNFKQVKSISGKYNSFLYDPESQILVGFPIGECKSIQTFIFESKRANNWFKGFQIGISFQHDQNLVNSVKKNKSLCLQYGRHNKDVFSKIINEDYFSTLIRMNQRSYLVLYFANQGLLKLYSLIQGNEKQLSIKLPSDSIPSFNVIDNMLIVHLKNQKITFIYDVAAQHIQPLVSPFPLTHMNEGKINNYQCQFVGHRAIHPSGVISKWKINLQVIHSYLKNELQIFDFYYRRRKAKMQMLQWLREDLFKIKQLNLSKFWKLLFAKYQTNQYPQSDVVSIIQIYGNIFYTLSLQELISKQSLMNIIIQAVRQALDVQIKIPVQLQRLLFDLLLHFKKIELLIYLSHNEVIKDSQELIKQLIKQYESTNQIMLATLAVDMASRISSSQNMVKILFKLQRVRDGKKYIKQNYDKVQVLYLIQVAKYIRNQTIKAQFIKFIKAFILQKFPAMNVSYLDQAQKKILG